MELHTILKASGLELAPQNIVLLVNYLRENKQDTAKS